jgi:exopolysaccharide biosynthesis polyprenyl glycosylphosphotransferase
VLPCVRLFKTVTASDQVDYRRLDEVIGRVSVRGGTVRSGDVASIGRTATPRSHARPRGKPRWYVPATIAVELFSTFATAFGVMSFSPRLQTVGVSLAVAIGWILVRALRHRYALSAVANDGVSAAIIADGMAFFGLASVGLLVADAAAYVPALAIASAAAVAVSCFWSRVLYGDVVRRRRQGTAITRTLLVGEPAVAQAVADHLARRSHLELVVVGVCPVGEGSVEIPPPVITRIPAQPVHPDLEASSVVDAAKRIRADLVAVVPGSSMHGLRLRRLGWEVHEAGLEFAVMPGVSEVSVSRLDVRSVDGLALLRVRPPRRSPFTAATKEVLDRSCAAALIVLLIPVAVAVAVMIKLDSPGPVLFRQLRVGRHGRPFTMWKFRTMVANAEELRGELLTANENTGLMFKVRRDPRMTRVGRVLRRFSIDELPQLVNVLRGDMSLVGPRPPLPHEVAGYNSVELRRLKVKPGMTGLWQISGRSDLTWEETVSIDLRYIDNWTLAGDVTVLLQTARAVVDGRGAY